jgi:hypothetical protein
MLSKNSNAHVFRTRSEKFVVAESQRQPRYSKRLEIARRGTMTHQKIAAFAESVRPITALSALGIVPTALTMQSVRVPDVSPLDSDTVALAVGGSGGIALDGFLSEVWDSTEPPDRAYSIDDTVGVRMMRQKNSSFDLLKSSTTVRVQSRRTTMKKPGCENGMLQTFSLSPMSKVLKRPGSKYSFIARCSPLAVRVVRLSLLPTIAI